MSVEKGKTERIDGVINIYKEKGYTSHDVVAKLRGILKIKKIGHTGTLDPDAEGVLPVCIGNATKLCDFIMEKDKEYVAELILGRQTDTQDISGRVINESDSFLKLTGEEISETVLAFVGEYNQIPPMYSAIKVNGKKMYELARKGIEVERKARKMHIYGIDILSVDIPVVKIKVKCSRGTYIRTLCNDIGERLGTYGCMGELIRTKSGSFHIDESIRLSQLEEIVRKSGMESLSMLIPTDRLLSEFASLRLKNAYTRLLINGNPLTGEMFETGGGQDAEKDTKKLTDGTRFRIYNCENEFMAVYRYIEDKKIFKPEKMFL